MSQSCRCWLVADMVIVDTLKKYIEFRRWLREVMVDAGLNQQPAPTKASKPAPRGVAPPNLVPTETDSRLAAVERELAELRIATAMLVSSKSSPPPSPARKEATPAPRTIPRPHPNRVDRVSRDDVHRALASTPTGASVLRTKPTNECTPCAKKRVAELTRDEVAVSLLTRFGTATSPQRVGRM
jgi:hypothetical protein